MNINIYPDRGLRRITNTVKTTMSKEEAAFVQDVATSMRLTMHANNGIGLAATQVGEYRRMFVFDSEFGEAITMINPDIVWHDGKAMEEEACLSIPGYSAKVERSALIAIKYYDIFDKSNKHDQFGGRDARVIQHELDHLNGTLFIDHLSVLKRNMFERKYKKMQKMSKTERY